MKFQPNDLCTLKAVAWHVARRLTADLSACLLPPVLTPCDRLCTLCICTQPFLCSRSALHGLQIYRLTAHQQLTARMSSVRFTAVGPCPPECGFLLFAAQLFFAI